MSVAITKLLDEALPLVDCPGAAHADAHVDHCGMCAPRWGKIPCPRHLWVLERIVETTKATRWAMPDLMIMPEIARIVEVLVARKLVKHVDVKIERKFGWESYYVLEATAMGRRVVAKLRPR